MMLPVSRPSIGPEELKESDIALDAFGIFFWSCLRVMVS
jgi:hypothetical protein